MEVAQKGRWAVTTLFSVNGFVTGAWAVQIAQLVSPDIDFRAWRIIYDADVRHGHGKIRLTACRAHFFHCGIRRPYSCWIRT